MGEIFALISAWSFSTANVVVRLGMRTARDDGVFMSVFVNMVIFWIFILILHFARWLPALTPMGFFLFVLAGLLTTFGGRSLHFAAIRFIGPSRAGSFKCSAPLFTVCLAFVFLSERFTLTQFSGTAAVLGGIWVLTRETSRRTDLAVARVPSSDTSVAASGLNRRVASGGSSLRGVLCALSAAATFGTGTFVRKLAVLEVPSPFWGMAIGATTAWLAVIVQATITGGVRELFRDNFRFQAPARFFILTGLSTTAGQMFNYLAIYHTAVSIAIVLGASEPLHTLVMSRLLLGGEDPLNWRVWLSATAVFLGIVLVIL